MVAERNTTTHTRSAGTRNRMTAHLTLPYNWIDCAAPENCTQHIHLQDTAEELNSYPHEWVEAILNCRISTEEITFINNAGDTHKNNSPAVIHQNGTIEWWIDGKLHREDGPAVTEPDGYEAWCINGQYHRENNPAIIWSDGTQEWWVNGKLHREDGPAIILPNGEKQWRQNGTLYRENGPQIERANGTKEWYSNSNGQLHHTEEPETSKPDTKPKKWATIKKFINHCLFEELPT